MKVNPELRILLTIWKWILIVIGILILWAAIVIFGLLIGVQKNLVN
jgi:hypothetical protein